MFYTNVTQINTKILHRYVDDDGERKSELVHFEPTLYLPTKTKTDLRGIRGEYLTPKTFGGIKEARNFIKDYDDVSNFGVHGNQNYWAQFIQETYTGEVQWDMRKLVVANLDIETLINDPNNPGLNPLDSPIEGVNRITAITIEVNNRYYVFGSKPFDVSLCEDDVKYLYCPTETKLLSSFLKFWGVLEPDIVTGWNINYFDIPYLIGRISRVLGDDSIHKLGPTAYKHNERTVGVREHRTGDGIDISIDGISIIDYLESYKKFTYKTRERYSLDHIAFVELGEKKIDYSEYGNLDGLYEKNHDLYILYNIKDVKLVRRLDDKLNLMMLIMTLTYMCHIPHQDVFSQVRMWDTLIYNYLLERNVVVPPKAEFHKSAKYEGAYSMRFSDFICS